MSVKALCGCHPFRGLLASAVLLGLSCGAQAQEVGVVKAEREALLEVGVVATAGVLAPGLAEQIGYGYIGAANALAAIGMAVWLKRFALHRDDEPEA